ncbi:MAG: GNAT family N-acetyltransferase [Trueperaceae bacterium]
MPAEAPEQPPEQPDGRPRAWPAKLPPGYSARPATLADAAAVAAVIAADQAQHMGKGETTAAHVLADWGGADLAEESLVIEDPAGRVVAAADFVLSRAELVLAYGYVHPEFTGRGIGTCLISFFEGKAARLSATPARVRHYLPERNGPAAALLTTNGYQLVRAVLRMERELAEPPPAPAWPADVSVRAYRGEVDEPTVYEAFELGSTGMWGRPGNDLKQWTARAFTYDPTLFRIAQSSGSIVGLAISEVPAPDDPAANGHVQSLRVVPEWRRRGLGGALLADALWLLHGRGARSVHLTVDSESPSGAPRLYLAAGMRVTARYLVYERQPAPATP